MFRTGALGLALSAGVMAALTGPSGAAMTGEAADPGAAPSLVQQAQIELPFPFPAGLFFFGGHDWCWYDNGWQGGGWYWCGYGYRTGYGYGGPEGFHGWSQHRYERDWHGGHGGGPGGPGGERHEFHGGGPQHGPGGPQHGGGGPQHGGGGPQHGGGGQRHGDERHENH